MVEPFIFNTSPSIRFGDGCLKDIGSILSVDGHDSAPIVTDPGMMATDIVSEAINGLEITGITTNLYGEVNSDITSRKCAKYL